MAKRRKATQVDSRPISIREKKENRSHPSRKKRGKKALLAKRDGILIDKKKKIRFPDLV